MAGYGFLCTRTCQYTGSFDHYIHWLENVLELVWALGAIISCASGGWTCFGNNGTKIHKKEAGYHGDSIMFNWIINLYACLYIFSYGLWDIFRLASTGIRD